MHHTVRPRLDTFAADIWLISDNTRPLFSLCFAATGGSIA